MMFLVFAPSILITEMRFEPFRMAKKAWLSNNRKLLEKKSVIEKPGQCRSV